MRVEPAFPTNLHGDCFHILPANTECLHPMILFFGAKDLAPHCFNFFQLGRELDCHRFFLNNGENHWYQYGIPGLGNSFQQSIETLLKWQKALSATHIYTVGTSMGGYAAIQYGVALEANILAFSTDASINQPLSKSASFFTGDQPASCPDLCELISGRKTNLTLIAGERDISDLYSAWLLKKAADIQIYTLVGVDHITPTSLSKQSRLGPMLRKFIQTGEINLSHGTGNAINAGNYVQQMHRATAEANQLAPDWRAVEHHTAKALEDYPAGEAGQSLLGEALLKQGKFEAAIPILAQAVAGKNDNVETLILLSLAWRKTGCLERSKTICHSIIEQQPGNHKALSTLALTYASERDWQAAIGYMTKAVRIKPTSKKYKDHLSNFKKKLHTMS